MNSAAKSYVASIVLAGAATMAIAAYFYPPDAALTPYLFKVAIIAVFSVIGEAYIIPLPKGAITTATVVNVGAAILLDPFWAAVTAATGAVCVQLYWRTAWYRNAFNTSGRALSTGVAALALRLILGNGNLLTSHNAFYTLMALGVMVLIYYGIDSFHVDVILALTKQGSVWYHWVTNHKDLIALELGFDVMGVLFAIAWQVQWPFVIFIVLPVVVSHFAFDSIKKLRAETKDAIIALADSIDARDPYTFKHSVRVAMWSDKICREMKLREGDHDLILQAARVHDLGKIGIRSEVLNKPGPLTEEEWKHMQEHPTIGADILGWFSTFADGVEIVRHHHESVNGKGYPGKLILEKIPLGSRIICVADAYDAMTSDRPYRKGMPRAVAMQRLAECSGTQFDSQVVTAFEHIIAREPEEEREAEAAAANAA